MNKGNNLKIPLALDSNTRRLVSVDSVSRGKMCACECPSCGSPLLEVPGM